MFHDEERMASRARAARPKLMKSGLISAGIGFVSGDPRRYSVATRFDLDILSSSSCISGRAKAIEAWRSQPLPSHDPRAKLLAPPAETPCAEARFAQIVTSPNTHVPVVVCRSAGIWTRGQSTALGRPAAGGEPANPAKRGTRLEATTDRAFLVSAGPPKVGVQRGLSILPGVRTGHFLVQTMALIA